MRKIIYIVIMVIIAFVLLITNSSNKMKKIEVGDTIPSFELLNQFGELVSINHKMNKPLVIYFYPKDDTPGCTKEACKFRDEFEQFSNLKVEVFGISADNVESHKNFAKKYNLPFQLLYDVNNKTRKQFGVPKTLGLFPGRTTYIIDNKGIVKYIFNSQFKAEKHIEIALQKLKEI